ncbi:MAG TPA: YceH family protein [Opitutaceae bacterium]|nr:YceH family protein [Opitutaceae bacterium]
MNPLNPVEVRVLGSLIEKDITTPDYYPMTLNALTNACNQSSNRDPVVSFLDKDVVRGLDSLREKKLAFMFQGADSRVAKYGHRFSESLGLDRPQVAIMCVLMLRGPQTVGEVRGRTGRMHEFKSLEETAAALEALIAMAPAPLVVRLPRQPGFKEQRYGHLLSGEAPLPAHEALPGPEPAAMAVPVEGERMARLEAEAAALRAEVAELRRQLADLRKQLE